MVQKAPYGSWQSPVTSDLIVRGGVRLGTVVVDGDAVYAAESRPSESGRTTVVRIDDRGGTQELLPSPYDTRSRVHEYGGGSFTVKNGTLLFVGFRDQRLYRMEPGTAPVPVTPESNVRYAAPQVDPIRDRVVAVAEDHDPGAREPENRIVSVDARGQFRRFVLASGRDFYASPRLSPDGRRLAWIEWDHPNMPWDGTDLVVADLDDAGHVTTSRRVAGGPRESIFQPEWGRSGALYFVSDASGFWNPHRLKNDVIELLQSTDAEFGLPLWNFEMSTYAVLDDERLVCTYTRDGRWFLALLDPERRTLEPLDIPYTDLWNPRASGTTAYFGAASPTRSQRLVAYDLQTRTLRELRRFSDVDIDPAFLSEPRPIEFETTGGARAHALYYPPKNENFRGLDDERPPLLVKSHGGPTAAASTTLNLKTQFWTSRGIGVLDVNYRGSTGYGRAYRDALQGKWGVADVDDCVAGALHLVALGEVDEHRLMITGGSAGGYTTLAALALRDVFHAGASHYGISDLEALVRDTHKFESRYLDGLVGPYPERRDLYVERSPIHHVDSLSCPVIFFQGLEDRVVPPNQAELMVRALAAKGIRVAYVAFQNESHGFRRAENIRRSVDAELFFYSKVIGFPLADRIAPVAIENE
jgi:dipeptidyl aminopeptidase/acylaminoacyl peptidase